MSKSKLSDDQRAIVESAMSRTGSYYQAATEAKSSYWIVRLEYDPTYREKERLRRAKRRSEPTVSLHDRDRPMTAAEVLVHRQRLDQLDDRRGLTARLLGDPVPGFHRPLETT